MPEYIYICDNGHEVEIWERMNAGTTHICEICGRDMHRKPTMPMINWGGRKPSAGGISPLARELEEGAPQRREQYQKLKENYERDHQSSDSD